jgi:hypothetical protein
MIHNYFLQLWTILAHPSRFFRELSQQEVLVPRTSETPESESLQKNPIAGPIAFALVTHWLGAACNYLWHLAIGGSITDFFQKLMLRAGDSIQFDNPGQHAQLFQLQDQVTGWFMSAGSIIADPFLTLFSIFFTSSLVYVGARIFVPRQTSVNYASAVKIIAFGMTPSILAAIPALGGFIAPFYTIIVTIIGAREMYHISNARAFVVALFPKVLFIGLLTFGFLFFAITLFQFFTSFFY